MIKEKDYCRYCKHRQFNPYTDRAQCELGKVMDIACEHYEIGDNDYASKDEGYHEFDEINEH